MSKSNLPKRIMTLGEPSDYPPDLFAEISAACDFAIAANLDGQVRVVKDRHGIVPRQPTLRELTSVQVVTPADVVCILGYPDGSADYASRDDAPAPDGWQGTQPAEGTRRSIILDTIRSSPDGVPMTPLDLADRIESALLDSTIADEADEAVRERAHDALDRALRPHEDPCIVDLPVFRRALQELEVGTVESTPARTPRWKRFREEG